MNGQIEAEDREADPALHSEPTGRIKVELSCNVCGVRFRYDFRNNTAYDGRVCSKGCWDRFQLLRVCSLLRQNPGDKL